jgi:hypothetical protein
MIGTYVEVARFLLHGAPPAPSLVQQLEVSASTSSQSQVVIPKSIAQCFFKPNQYAIASWIGR